ncbi:MAG: NGG1p interacting factor NIF3 [Gammaproteobacteria bacterium]|nr:NGG1p interacting factor NIF3 [Gammaproteobacteria bacterium]
MYTLFFYVPESHLEIVKDAVFAAGAGAIGDYQNCCWQVLGQGQFRPLAGSQPFIGEQDQLEQVAEWRVEMVVVAAYIKPVMTALKAAHPYEEPAYAVYRLESF